LPLLVVPQPAALMTNNAMAIRLARAVLFFLMVLLSGLGQAFAPGLFCTFGRL
jgi:hypothetical protein